MAAIRAGQEPTAFSQNSRQGGMTVRRSGVQTGTYTEHKNGIGSVAVQFSRVSAGMNAVRLLVSSCVVILVKGFGNLVRWYAKFPHDDTVIFSHFLALLSFRLGLASVISEQANSRAIAIQIYAIFARDVVTSQCLS